MKQIDLLSRAKDMLGSGPDPAELSPEDVRNLAHGLAVHQIELEMQIDELHKSQIQTTIARDKYADLFEFAPIAYITLNKIGLIIEANSAAMTLFNVERRQLLNHLFSDFKETVDGFIPGFAAQSTDNEQTCEMSLQKGDKTCFQAQIITRSYYNKTDDENQLRVTITDITERKKAERAIEELSKLSDENQDPVMRIHKGGAILYANAASDDLMEEWLTQKGTLVPADWIATISDARISGERIVKQVMCGTRTYSFSITPIQSQDYVNLYGHDITIQLELEKEVRQRAKREAISQLAGGLAHDLNNKLQGIFYLTDTLINTLENSKCREWVEQIDQCATQSADLVQKLLAFAQADTFPVVPADLHLILQQLQIILAHSLDKRITVTLKLNATAPITMGGSSQLESALLNIMLNAKNAMPNGGELIVSTENLDLGPEFCDSTPFEINPGPYIKVRIQDSGSGMSNETKEHIFEPFYTTRDVGQGSGMGLASVYGTVESHHGAIVVDNHLEHGTAFDLYFPSANSDIQEPRVLDESIAYKKDEVQIATKTILVVDDEDIIREMATVLLEMKGYATIAARNGREAVDIYTESWNDIDLVLLDISMPIMDGYDAFALLRDINPEVKVIFASGFDLTECKETYHGEGVLFLPKPYRCADLEDILTTAFSADA